MVASVLQHARVLIEDKAEQVELPICDLCAIIFLVLFSLLSPGSRPGVSIFHSESAAAAPTTRARRPRRAVYFDEFQPDDDDGWD